MRNKITLTITEDDAKMLLMMLTIKNVLGEPNNQRVKHDLQHALLMCTCDKLITNTRIEEN